jgi:hypothetical protein
MYIRIPEWYEDELLYVEPLKYLSDEAMAAQFVKDFDDNSDSIRNIEIEFCSDNGIPFKRFSVTAEFVKEYTAEMKGG